MRGALFYLCAVFSFGAFGADYSNNIMAAQSRCMPFVDGGPVITSSLYKGSFSPEEMKAKFNEIYTSGKRLLNHVYFDQESGKFISEVENSISVIRQFELQDTFLKAIIGHVELALKKKHAEYIFFPDMGHSHFFTEFKFYNAELKQLPVSQQGKKLELMLAHPETKVLYHTAEKLIMKDEDGNLINTPENHWRFYTRNPVGDMAGKIELITDFSTDYNTARDLDGYRFGYGFDISSSNEGCFPYKDADGATKYFDISFFSMPYSTDGSFPDGGIGF